MLGMNTELAVNYSWIADIATLFEGPDLRPIERLVAEYERDAAAIERLAEMFEDEYRVSMMRYLATEGNGYGQFRPMLTRERVAHRDITSAVTRIAYIIHHECGETILKWHDGERNRSIEVHDRAPQDVPYEDREMMTRVLCAMQRDINDASGRLVALRKLDADYWSRALAATDVLSSMPAERQREWRTMIENRRVPPFCAESVAATIGAHLANRHKYFAERVAGVFRALSPDHRTNLATGFGGRLIIANAVHRSSYGYNGDVLRDLRIVVSKFLGHEIETGYQLDTNTERTVSLALHMHQGQWCPIDGGAMEIRVYKKGTCHVRLHEEMVWRLNAILASECPGAIPESARTRPAYTGARKRSGPSPVLMVRPLPTLVLNAIADILTNTIHRERYLPETDVSAGYEWVSLDKHVRAQVFDVIEALGGVRVAKTKSQFRFDYPPIDVLRSVVLLGAVPDSRAHQFYPTPEAMARRVVEMAEIGEADTVLEPSAGTGSIARLLPVDRTLAVEVSELHAKVLEARGLRVWRGDFLRFGEDGLFTRVVMNPPFDRGQARAHVEHAAGLLEAGGRLVAVLPASMQGPLVLPGWSMRWTPPERFPGTSMDVAILVADKPVE